MTRQTTFSFTLAPTVEQSAALCRHVGAARFAFNQCLRMVFNALEAKSDQPEARVPWSGFDLINAFNAWKRSAEAGVDADGKPGLVWRDEVCAQVYEEAAVDLGRALEAFSAWRRGERKGKRPNMPRFKKKSTARRSFRLRNKGSGTKSAIRLGERGARSVRLPKLGTMAVRECTRKLRRMLNKGRAKIWFATVSQRAGGHWRLTLNVEAAAFHPQQRHDPNQRPRVVGIDRGLTTFAVLADPEGEQLERIESPRPLREALPRLRRRSRALSRKQKGSRNRFRARVRLARLHQRIADLRKDFMHRESTRLAKTHGHLVIEKLCISGLIRSRLSRAIADSAWALFATLLSYKASWYGAVLTEADRFYPSTRRCSACGETGNELPLNERTFRCSSCGHEADRDTNAAACLAQYPEVLAKGFRPDVAAKHAETQNVRGEESADARSLLIVRETVLREAERASAWRPRRAVLVQLSTRFSSLPKVRSCGRKCTNRLPQ
jgi:putative transposase